MNSLLLVEDDPGDVVLIQEAFADCGVPCEILVAGTGDEAVARLKAGARPDIIILDLNLPGRDGFEVVAELKRDPKLALIPILMLTTSSAQGDVDRAYKVGVNCYLVKPMDLGRIMDLASQICRFWFRSASLPTKLL